MSRIDVCHFASQRCPPLSSVTRMFVKGHHAVMAVLALPCPRVAPRRGCFNRSQQHAPQKPESHILILCIAYRQLADHF
jgi:hypothetical protein